MEILDNATLWVGVSFVLFILLVFKPLLKSTNRSLDDKITNIKNEKIRKSGRIRIGVRKWFRERKYRLLV